MGIQFMGYNLGYSQLDMTFEIGLEMGHPSNSQKKYVAKFAKMLKA